MAQINLDFGETGSAEHASHGEQPTLADAMRDVADDLANSRPATIASADASDLATAQTLVNEIKAALNAATGTTLLTTKG